MNVIFEEATHSYHTMMKGQKIYGISVTTIIEKFRIPYQTKFWSTYRSIQNYLEMEKPEMSKLCKDNGFNWYKFLEEEEKRIKYLKSCIGDKICNWEEAIKKAPYVANEWEVKKNNKGKLGTEFHEYKEEQAHKTKVEKINGSRVNLSSNATMQLKAIKYSVDLTKLEDGYHSEVLVYITQIKIGNKTYNVFITGQVDKLFIETIDGVRYITLDDYKTNDKITTENNFQKFRKPLNHLPDTKLIGYSLQLGLYGRILEEYGYVVKRLFFTHHDLLSLGMTNELDKSKVNTEYTKVYELTYYKNELHEMIKYYCNEQGLKIENNGNSSDVDYIDYICL